MGSYCRDRAGRGRGLGRRGHLAPDARVRRQAGGDGRLIAAAVALEPVSEGERLFFIAALLLGLLSDVFLMLPRDMFLAGLVAAFVEHLAYIAGFRARDLHAGVLALALAVALVSVAAVMPAVYRASARPTFPACRSGHRLRGGVRGHGRQRRRHWDPARARGCAAPSSTPTRRWPGTDS